MIKVAIQLYSVRQNMAKDPINTIQRVADIGYKNLELANHNAHKDPGTGFGLTVQQTKDLIEKTGISIVSAHISPLDVRKKEQLRRTLEFQRDIGVKYVATNLHDFTTAEVTLRYVDFLNQLGTMCKEYGIQLVYHNHFLEFSRFEDGDCAFDLMMRNVDADLLKIQLDTYWAMRAARNPVDIMRRYGERVCLIHQKDYPKGAEADLDILYPYLSKFCEAKKKNEIVTDEDRENLTAKELDDKSLKLFMEVIQPELFTEINQGIMNIQEIIDVANTYCHSDYIILEQDYTQKDEFDSIQESYRNFQTFTGVETL